MSLDSSKKDKEQLVHQQTLTHLLPPTRLKWSYSHLESNPFARNLAVSGAEINLYKLVDEDVMEVVESNSSASKTGLRLIQNLTNNLSGRKPENSAPVTNLDWNFVDPSILASCSIDTTCTIWNIETGQPKTQLIAHDKQVYDISFSNAMDIFASVGGDGSVRLFDLRNLEHSTILYENTLPYTNATNTDITLKGSSLFRIAWNKLDNHFLATFQEDSNKIVLLDNRLPSIPVAELVGHATGTSLVDVCWAPNSSSHLASLSSDGQILIWDLLDPDFCHVASKDPNHPSFQNLPPINPAPTLNSSPSGHVSPVYGFTLESGTGCQLVWPQEAPDVVAATDNQSLWVIPI